MTSPFDPLRQQESLDARIVAALEKLSESFRVMLWEAGKRRNLSPIQVQVLVFLLFHDPARARITFLAAEFSMTKPTMSEVIRALEQKKLVEKTGDKKDSRSFQVFLTREGRETAEKLSAFALILEKALGGIEEREKEEVYSGLYRLLASVSEEGVIKKLRHCARCAHFEGSSLVSWCGHYKKALTRKDMRIDCEAFKSR